MSTYQVAHPSVGLRPQVNVAPPRLALSQLESQLCHLSGVPSFATCALLSSALVLDQRLRHVWVSQS